MYKYLLTIAVLLLFTSNTLLFSQKSGQEKLPAIAVLPFIGSGINASDGDTLAGLLGNALTGVTKEKFRILPRNAAMAKVLEEHSYQDSGLTSTSNRAAMMKGVGADYIITVDVETFGSKKLVIASMIDINDQKQTAGYYFEYQTIGEITERLTEISEVLINKTEDNLGKSNSILAVLPFSITAEGLANTNDAQVLAQMLASSIANSGKYSVAIRTDTLDEVKKEYERAHTGLLNKDDTPKEDEGINADYVLAGFISSLDNKPLINVQVLTTEGFEQVIGTSIDFKQISDLIETMPNISYKITGIRDENYSLSGLDYLLESYEGKTGISDIKSLLANGINSKNKDGWTALMYASRHGYTDIVKSLIEGGANLNLTEEDNWTALMLASRNGHADIVNALIEAGANLNLTTAEYSFSDGWTALMMASRNGHADIVNALIEAGANVNIKYGNSGQDAYVFAKYYGDYPDIANSLVAAGAKAKVRKSYKYTNYDWYAGWMIPGGIIFTAGLGISIGGLAGSNPTIGLFRDPEPINDIFGNRVGLEFDPKSMAESRGLFYGGIGVMTLGAIFMIVGATAGKNTGYEYSYEPKKDLFLQPYFSPDIDGSVAMGLNFRYSF